MDNSRKFSGFQLLESFGEAVLLLDKSGYIKYANCATASVTGYSGEDLINKSFALFCHNQPDTVNVEYELDLAEKQGRIVLEGWRPRKDGNRFWGEMTLATFRDGQSGFSGYTCMLRDVTERKNTELALQKSEELYRLMTEGVKDYAIFMLDPTGCILTWNEGARRNKGYSANEVIGKHFSLFYTREDNDNNKPRRELEIAMATGKYEEEGWRLRKDGSLFWANVVITAVYSNDGNHIGFSKVTRDLTERKASEKALRDSHDRYRKLSEELRATNEELSYANGELEQFTSIVSHDLQEPIRTIKSFLQLIDIKLGAGQYENLKTYISKSIQAANRMRGLIQNLLHYSQLAKHEIAIVPVDVDELFDTALQNLRTSLEAANARITIENEVKTVQGDPVQLLQLIQNLLSNAIKFTGDREPQIAVHCMKERGHAKFAVSDNGIGISREDLGKVFDIFRRLDTKKDYPGTGIGLAICKKIVDRHHGRIWPESEPDKGTTFHFTINEQSPADLQVL